MFWFFIGWLAVTLTAIQFIPQVVKAIRTKRLKDISLLTFTTVIAAASVWILHGIHTSDLVIISANILVLISALIIMGLKIKYRH